MPLNLEKLLTNIIQKHYGIDEVPIHFETPPKKNLGDYAFGCFILSKQLKKPPHSIAEELSTIINHEHTGEISSIIESSSHSGPYLNIKQNKRVYQDIFYSFYPNLKKEISSEKNKTIFVDYIGTNIGKLLHIGHMCTPNIGQALINAYKKLGYTIVSDSHIGDWGIIFGKLITAYKLLGSEKSLKQNAVEHLGELYIKITTKAEQDPNLEQQFRNEFKLLSQGDPEAINLWKLFTTSSIEYTQTQLNRLDIKPDYDIGESFYEGIGLPKIGDYPDLKYNMQDIVLELTQKGIATQNADNSIGVTFDDHSNIPSCILQKRDTTHGYLASDLAGIKYRVHNWSLEKILYCVDVRQQLHFRQAFYIAKKAGWLGNTQLIHVSNGAIRLKEGAMSTRKGTIVKLDLLLDEAESRAKKIILEKRGDIVGEELQNLSKIIGIGAIKYGYLKKSRETDVIFDFDEFISFEGNSGPYIQYAYVRAQKILEKSDFSEKPNQTPKHNITLIENDEEQQLIKILGDYKKVLEEMVEKNMPHILCNYTYSLTKAFNSLYNNIHILNEENEEKRMFRLHLIDAFSYILKDAFGILGIQMPQRM